MYRLILVGQFQQNTATSVEVYTRALATHLQALGVTIIPLDFTETAFPEGDAVLFHAYHHAPAVQAFKARRPPVKFAAMFMELPLDIGCDHYFYYDCGNHKHVPARQQTLIPIPLDKSLYSIVPKRVGSILLDHDYECFAQHNQPDFDWNHAIWDLVDQNRDMFPDIYQLARGAARDRPSCIKVIPLSDLPEYLRATQAFETFVATHAGSYNHTAMDMAVRGTRIVVPQTKKFGTFIPQGMIDQYGMQVCHTPTALIAMAIDNTWQAYPRIHQATDMNVVALIIHRKILLALSQ